MNRGDAVAAAADIDRDALLVRISRVASWEPSLAARRLTFALIVMSISAMVLLCRKVFATSAI